MPNQSTTSASIQHQRRQDKAFLRGMMDRRSLSSTWPYSYPPFPSVPGWFPVNGVGYQPQFTSGAGAGSMETVGMGIPVWFQSPDMRGMPAMFNPGQQHPASQAQEASSAPTNSNTNNGGDRGAAGPSTRNGPPATENANSNSAIVALVPSRPSSPMTVDMATQCLLGQLHDAIRLCNDCLTEHTQFVATVQYVTTETRNGVWKDLLKHKLESSGFSKDGFNNFGRRLSYYMEKAYCASQNDPALESGQQEMQRKAKDRIRHLRLLRATCDEVVKLSKEVSVDALDCKEMLALMEDMEKKLSWEQGYGENGGDGGNAS